MDIDQGPSPTPLSTQLLEGLPTSKDKDPNNKQIWAVLQKSIIPVIDNLRAEVGELRAKVGELTGKNTRQDSRIALLSCLVFLPSVSTGSRWTRSGRSPSMAPPRSRWLASTPRWMQWRMRSGPRPARVKSS